jgi:hypothetical protein
LIALGLWCLRGGLVHRCFFYAYNTDTLYFFDTEFLFNDSLEVIVFQLGNAQLGVIIGTVWALHSKHKSITTYFCEPQDKTEKLIVFVRELNRTIVFC